MNSDKIIIAIDGFSSTGKSTLAKQLAKKLGYIYVDTGAMYRAVTLFALEQKFISEDHFDVNELVMNLHQIEIGFKYNEALGFAEVYLNGANVEKQIRTMYVSGFVSKVATVPEVRYMLVKQQKQIGAAKGLVMDGRDIGTVVFPEAELKLFMEASDQVRAERRYNELKERGDDITFDEVLKNVRERDYIDSNRENSPLKKADDAVAIDNSNLTIEEQFQKILALVSEKTNN